MTTKLRNWKIEWEIPARFTVGDLWSLREDVQGYGAVSIEHDDGVPKVLHAEFTTSPEWNEFDLADSLRETAVNFDIYGESSDSFPSRPTEVQQ